MTQRDGMGREEGSGFRMGNTCIPVADSFDIWQNQYNIVKFKNKMKLKKKNTQLWMQLVIEARSDAIKTNIA